MSEPLAYLLTWTCYGTWLHGNERGSVTRDDNAYGSPFVDAQPRWARMEAARLSDRPVMLDDAARGVVREAILDHCRHRGWSLLAVNIRTNHAHVVVAYDPGWSADRLLASLKARATRCLRENRYFGPRQRIWTQHGSTRYLWKSSHVDAAIDYVLNGQGADVRFAAFDEKSH